MQKYDYHTHSNYSSDSDAKIEDMILSAIQKDIKEIAITDHVDLDYPPVDYFIMSEIDFQQYNNERLMLRDKYKHLIYVVLGIEMGLQVRCKDIIDDYVKDKQLDFVVGSTHVVDWKDLYDGSHFKGKTQAAAFLEYFEDVLYSVNNFDMFDVYGHLDFVNRYGNYETKNLAYIDYKEIVDEILKAIIKKGKGIEINTSGYRYKVGGPHPKFEFIKRYKELGGEIITTGSDAHFPKDVAFCFDEVYDMLRAAGFKTVTTFRERKPIFVEIG